MNDKIITQIRKEKYCHVPEEHIIAKAIANTPEYIRRYYEIAGKTLLLYRISSIQAEAKRELNKSAKHNHTYKRVRARIIIATCKKFKGEK